METTGSEEPEPVDVPRGTRPHHYLFAREWLRQSFERRPEMLVLALARATARDEGAVPVRETWRGMGKSLPEDDRVDPQQMSVRTFVDETTPASYFAIIELPPPMATGEAHAIGLAVVPAGGELQSEDDDLEGARDGTVAAYGLAEATESGPRLIVIDGEETTELDHQVTDDPGESLLMALRHWIG
jgi:hypothetical protein